MIEIFTHHLEFLEEAKAAFNENPRFETYRNEHDSLIALRYGRDRDSILVFELGMKVAFFHNVADKAPNLVVQYED